MPKFPRPEQSLRSRRRGRQRPSPRTCRLLPALSMLTTFGSITFQETCNVSVHLYAMWYCLRLGQCGAWALEGPERHKLLIVRRLRSQAYTRVYNPSSALHGGSLKRV